MASDNFEFKTKKHKPIKDNTRGTLAARMIGAVPLPLKVYVGGRIGHGVADFVALPKWTYT